MCERERDKTQERKISKNENFQIINFKKTKKEKEKEVHRDQAKRLETFAQHTQSYTLKNTIQNKNKRKHTNTHTR